MSASSDAIHPNERSIMFPALTQFFNDFTVFGGDLLSIAFSFGG
ncbi:hypothetical protein [Gordonia zhenghanii]|nr:hypothetical protein [Gordonia zhenghanii]